MSAGAAERLLRSLGVFVLPDALRGDDVRDIRNQLQRARSVPAAVGGALEPAYSEVARSAELLEAPPALHDKVRRTLDVLRTSIEGHLDRCLGEMEPIGFLRYGPGGFHAAHADTAADAVSRVRHRGVSAVVFLNDGVGGNSPEFDGGSLVFYGLLPGDDWETRGIALAPRSGMLVAFPSTMTHEVVPVLRGERLSVVTWFHRP